MGHNCCTRIIVLVFSFLVFLVFTMGISFGVGFPEKPIKVIIPYPAGSSIDAEARCILPFVEKHLGVRVTIENIPGADQKIGLTKVWKAKPDGYTLLIHTTTMSVIGEYIILNPEYRIIDLSHIFSWSQTNSVLVVNTETWKSFAEFVKAARERVLSAGLPGRGTSSHLNALILADKLGIKANWVPFDGSAEVGSALAGKHIDFSVCATTSALPLVKAGKLKPLLVLADSKDNVFPDIPLAREAGYNFNVIPLIRGADGPPKIPTEVIGVLETAFGKAAKEPEFLAWAEKRMMKVVPLNHDEYRKAIEGQQKETAKYKDLLKGTN
ncbi:MAG: tripartite tricarboxylate transporter substrate binding protein [Thermodesulfobacteriota bacterium]